MKILVVSQTFSRGGLETQIKTYYENLPENTEMVFAFANYTQDILLNDAKIHTGFNFKFDCTIKEFCEDVERLVKIIKDEKIDVIHAHPFYSFFAALFASQLTKTKLVYTFHGLVSFNFLNTFTVASIFKYAFDSGAIAQLHSVSDTGIKCFEEIGYKNSVFIPNPIDITKFKAVKYVNNKKWAIFSRIDDDKLKEIKLFIANMDKYGIEAIDIYGAGCSEQELIDYINTNSLSETVQFKGFCTNLNAALDGNYNGLAGIGRVVLEGLTMGLPVFLIGYGKLSGFINKSIYEKIKSLNFTNNFINDNNFILPEADEILEIQKDVINTFSAKKVVDDYTAALKKCESIYLKNLEDFYGEIKALANNKDTANNFFNTHKDIIRLTQFYIQPFSASNDLNNMYVVYSKCDELVTDLQNVMRLQQTDHNEVQALQKQLGTTNSELKLTQEQIQNSHDVMQYKLDKTREWILENQNRLDETQKQIQNSHDVMQYKLDKTREWILENQNRLDETQKQVQNSHDVMQYKLDMTREWILENQTLLQETQAQLQYAQSVLKITQEQVQNSHDQLQYKLDLTREWILENQTLLQETQNQVAVLQQLERERTEREQAEIQRKNMRLHRRVFRKIKRILKIKG